MSLKTDFGQFYAGGGIANPAYAQPAQAVDQAARDKLAAVAAAIPAMDPDGAESLADVKGALDGIKTALE